MIQIQNNYLPKNLFYALQDICENTKFDIVKLGDKQFSIMDTPMDIIPFFQIPGHEIVLTFIRDAYPGFDNDMRIHADNIIQGHKTSFASVLYINNPHGVTPNGTAFWEHEKHGLQLQDDVSNEEFDRLITEDSNNLSKWTQNAYVGAIPNRLVTYNSQQFHSKVPAKIEIGRRIVLVVFYKKL